MSSKQSPVFELFQRGLTIQTVKEFRGMNAYRSATVVTPDEALECLNVMIPGTGGVSKFRLPVQLSADPSGTGHGPFQIFDFQQANGTRQVVATFAGSLYYYTWVTPTQLSAGTLIDNAAGAAQPWSMVESNQILYGANGVEMKKWTGSNWQNTGLVAPVAAPTTSVVVLPGAVAMFQINGAVGQNLIYCFVAIPPGINIQPGQNATIAGTVHYNGTYEVNDVATGGYTLVILTSAPPPSTLFDLNMGTITPSFPPPVIGWSWSYAFKNSVTGTISNVSPATPSIIPDGGKMVQLLAIIPPDTQADTLVWFRTLDGGGDYFRLCEVNINTGVASLPTVGTQVQSVLSAGKYIALNDQNTPDAALDQATQATLIYNPPPVGKYLVAAQSRVFVANLVGDPTAIAYSGYEQIVYPGARPEEAWPVNNRMRLAIGAEPVAGVGIIQSGVVAFSITKKMYMLKGAVEDVTLNAPIAFSAFLEELPWNIGTMCHQSIQSSAYGLLFWASDRTVQIFDGQSKPKDISGPVYPILRRATVNKESVACSAYFNWLERDWYGLSFPIDGSASNNYTIFWSLRDGGEIDIFPCSIGMECLQTVTSSALQRILTIGQQGKIMNLPVSQDTVNGVADLSIIPATNANLPAYWRGGYFGNDTPYRSKMARRGLAITDNGGFAVTTRIVDNKGASIKYPLTLTKKSIPADGSFSINKRCNRVSVEINFPDKDISCNLLELSVGWIATSDRL